ncbi:hypothetical protein J3Q64DRAFT_1695006 [Phycomyces blakesleeanus]|uniref:Uncharacterized protein n=1 Tax=Phycomyces blakesleeanus TaxID=4837 RepID=A0ABR3B935_PHYBL
MPIQESLSMFRILFLCFKICCNKERKKYKSMYLQNQTRRKNTSPTRKNLTKNTLRSLGHLTHTTPSGSAHQSEGRLANRQKKPRTQNPGHHQSSVRVPKLMFWNDYSLIMESTKVLAHFNELARWTAIFFWKKNMQTKHISIFSRQVVENMERLFKEEKGENMFRLTYDTERDIFELALTRKWSLYPLLTWCKRRQT